MQRIQRLLNNPLTGWSFAGLAVLFAIYLLVRSFGSSGAYDLATLSESVTVRFTDTNDEIKLTRGEFEKQLRGVSGTLTKEIGIVNPKTGKPTGILVASKEWEETIERINSEREWARQNSPFGAGASSPKKDK